MTTVIPRPLFVAVFVLLLLCGCSDKRRSTFERERQFVQKSLATAGELTSTEEAKQNGNTMESSWVFEFAGDKETAVKSFIANGESQIRRRSYRDFFGQSRHGTENRH